MCSQQKPLLFVPVPAQGYAWRLQKKTKQTNDRMFILSPPEERLQILSSSL